MSNLALMFTTILKYSFMTYTALSLLETPYLIEVLPDGVGNLSQNSSALRWVQKLAQNRNALVSFLSPDASNKNSMESIHQQ